MSRLRAVAAQDDLFGIEPRYPPGFRYQTEVITATEERRLIAEMAKLHFSPFEFQGFLGRRRVVSFGWTYDFNGGGLQKIDDMPDFLLPVREMAADFAGLALEQLQQALLLEYPSGATIGWHRDRSVFGEVVGVSLLSPCTFRLRKQTGSRWERASLIAAPRSAYLLRGPARSEWEHSIPAVESQRYSITFRNLREDAKPPHN